MKKTRKEQCSSKLSLILVSVAVCVLYFVIYLFSGNNEVAPFELSSSFDVEDAPSSLYGVCPLPRTVLPLTSVEKEKKTCEQEIPLTILTKEGQIVLNPLVNKNDKRRNSCYARPLYDSTSWPWTWTKAIAVFLSRNKYLFWYHLTDANKIVDDFVEVECLGYRNVHGRIRRRQEIPKRVSNTPDVYIIHVHSHKSNIFTPQTARYLEEAMGAVRFNNYQSLGDAYADFGAFLAAGLAIPLSKERMSTREVPTNLPRSFSDDPCFVARTSSYLPRIFQQSGYATLIADENKAQEEVFARGCGWEPASHYSPILREHPPVPGCKFADRVLDHLKRFVDVYEESTKFSTLRILHDDGVVDDELLEFFKDVTNKMDNTYVFFIADVPGEKNPSPIPSPKQNLWISVPKKLKDSVAMARLLGNQHELVTHLDMHATLRDIAGLTSVQSGSSLIGKLPPTVRDCVRLPIPLQHCPCPVEVVNYTDTATLFDATEAALEPLSDLLARKNCKRWDIERIYGVHRLEKLSLVDVYVAVRPMERNGLGFTRKYENMNFPVFKLMAQETRTADSSLVFTGLPLLSVALKPTDHSLSPCMKGHWLRPFCYCEPWML